MQHRPRRRVEQLHLGDAVENACDQLRQPPERVLAPVHLRNRDPLVRGGERRTRVLTGPPQRPRGRGAQLDGLLEADVERDGKRLRDARDDPLERNRVVEPGTSSANSSPPIGAAKPDGTTSVSRSAALRSTRSPTSWPCRSLTIFMSSRSTKTTPHGFGSALSRASRPARFGSPLNARTPQERPIRAGGPGRRIEN